jgi:hypothetical protein
MRIAGVRLAPSTARLLVDLLEALGSSATAGRVASALDRGVTTEAPLELQDYEAIAEALDRSCPPSLYRLHREVLEDLRRVRRITGG